MRIFLDTSKLFISFGFLIFLKCFSYADSVVFFSTTTNGCYQVRTSIDPAPYLSRNDVLIFNETTSQTEQQMMVLISTIPIRYFKKVGNPQIAEMTSTEKANVDAAIALARLILERQRAESLYDSTAPLGKILRAVILLVLDEINDLRTRDRDRATDVAAATSLADLKTRWAARSSLTDRTASQVRTAIRNKIESGSAD